MSIINDQSKKIKELQELNKELLSSCKALVAYARCNGATYFVEPMEKVIANAEGA